MDVGDSRGSFRSEGMGMVWIGVWCAGVRARILALCPVSPPFSVVLDAHLLLAKATLHN